MCGFRWRVVRLLKDSHGRLPSGETPCPKISRKHAARCKQQEVYWIRRYLGRQSLGGLAPPRLGVRGSYRRAKARVQKQKKAWLRGFISLVSSNKAKLSGTFLTFYLNTKEGVVQGLPVLAGDSPGYQGGDCATCFSYLFLPS